MVNVDIVNDFFASISYDCNSSSGYSLPTNFVPNESDVLIRYYELELYLRKIKPTAPGLDALPSWLFAKCSYELAGVIAHIFNSSFCAGVVPEQWKRSVVTHVAKVPKLSYIILITICQGYVPLTPGVVHVAFKVPLALHTPL